MSIPRAEHPNPQFMRDNWMNLNGEWQFLKDCGNSGAARKFYTDETVYDQTITVPFCPQSALSGIADKDFMYSVWYRRAFELSKAQCGGDILLHIGACDYETAVYVNGTRVGAHKGGYISFTFDITSACRAGGNTLVIHAQDDERNRLIPRGKQSEEYFSHQCDYTRTTGIWQTVWLEFVPKTRIVKTKYYPDIHAGALTITATLQGAGTLKAAAFYKDKPVGEASVTADGGEVQLRLALSGTHLWEAGHGRLYDLILTYGDDRVAGYFGLRNMRLDGYKFLINGTSVFQRLILDQGFYPDGIYTAPTDGALIADIERSLACGFNGARLHQKIFEPRFLYHADRMGYLVWGEYPNWGLDHTSPDAIYPMLGEWLEELDRDFNHPAIIGWCPFNETWDLDNRKQYDDLIAMVYKVTKAVDPTRPCIDTSGNFHVLTDIYDTHDYDQDPAVFKAHYDQFIDSDDLFDHQSQRQTYTPGLPVFISEYGGIQWSDGAGWGYGNAPATAEEFIERYKGLTEALLNNPKIFGFCYTQLTDVEQERNGLYTYDRTPKFDTEIFRRINTQKAAIEGT
ncbi:MAG: beta-galactosidase [Clostridia bacterium]|nr:beta-galactosidase [Clostridia bacterium]